MTPTKTPYLSNSPEDTWQLAADLLPSFPPSAVLALHGDLGSGKTCFVQGLALALHITQPVTSPTFKLINEYAGDRRLTHIDLYRMSSAEQVWALGLDETLEADGITAIEWADRMTGLLPPRTCHITFTATGPRDQRRITVASVPPTC